MVHPDQTCGVPGRFIGENVALLRNVVHFADDVVCPAAILSLDQEKAFDRVDWSFLFKVLERLGFGPSFVRWVQLLYSGVRSVVLVNGYASPPVFPSGGVRQRCPVSPMLYVLTMEVLAAGIRAHPDVVGLAVPGTGRELSMLSLYADDTSVIVTSEEAIEAVFAVYARFERGTGSQLNLTNCEGLWLGTWRGPPDSPVPIEWTSNRIKILGAS